MKTLLVITIVVYVVAKIVNILSMYATNKAHKDLHDWIDKGM